MNILIKKLNANLYPLKEFIDLYFTYTDKNYEHHKFIRSMLEHKFIYNKRVFFNDLKYYDIQRFFNCNYKFNIKFKEYKYILNDILYKNKNGKSRSICFR